MAMGAAGRFGCAGLGCISMAPLPEIAPFLRQVDVKNPEFAKKRPVPYPDCTTDSLYLGKLIRFAAAAGSN